MNRDTAISVFLGSAVTDDVGTHVVLLEEFVRVVEAYLPEAIYGYVLEPKKMWCDSSFISETTFS